MHARMFAYKHICFALQLLNANKTVLEVRAEAEDLRRQARSSNERYISLTEELKRDLEYQKSGHQASEEALRATNLQLQTDLSNEIAQHQRTKEENKTALAQKTQELEVMQNENVLLQTELTQNMSERFKMQQEHKVMLDAKDLELQQKARDLHAKETYAAQLVKSGEEQMADVRRKRDDLMQQIQAAKSKLQERETQIKTLEQREAAQQQQVAAGQEEKQAALAREDALLREINEAKEKVARSIEQRDAARQELASLQDTLSQTQHKQQLLERSLSKRDAEAALVAAKMDEMRNHKLQVEQELKDAFARLKVFMRRSMCAYS